MSNKRYSTDDYGDLKYNVVNAKILREESENNHVQRGRVSVLIKVKVRSSPTMNYTDDNVISTLPDGSEVEILGEENGFYNVRFGDTTGYCDKRFIAIDE